MENLRSYIQFLEGKTKADVLSFLTNASDLSRDQKNLIHRYLFPRPLADKELITRIQGVRLNPSGSLVPNVYESILIVEASRTAQYKRFIKHLVHSYQDISIIHPISGNDKCECCLCGKDIFQTDRLKLEFKDLLDPATDLYTAYGSTDTNLSICLPCLINLTEASHYLIDIDPNYLKSWGPVK